MVVLRDDDEAAGICGLVEYEGLEDVNLGFAFERLVRLEPGAAELKLFSFALRTTSSLAGS